MSAPWTIVARREVAAKLRDRAFLFSTGLMLLVITVALGMQALLGNRAHHFTVAADGESTPLVEQVAVVAKARNAKTSVTPTVVTSEAAATAAIDDGSADAWLHRSGEQWVLTAKAEPDADLLAATAEAVRAHALAANAAAAGTTVEALTRGSTVRAQALDGSGEASLLP